MLNYFELMGMPARFQLDIDKLQQHMRARQAQFHPDTQSSLANNSASSSNQSSPYNLAQLKTEQISAVINDAYQTLKSPDTRAAHLLALHGIVLSTDTPIRDLNFLDEAMDFRISLDAASTATIDSLSDQLQEWIAQTETAFEQRYEQLAAMTAAVDNKAITAVSLAVQKLQFLVKLATDVAKKRDELVLQSQPLDDDLYV